MLKCAIAGCQAQEKFLRSGSLQLLDALSADNVIVRKMVWFCAGCTKKYIVQGWRPAGEQVRPRSAPAPFAETDMVQIAPAPIAGRAVGPTPRRPAA